MPRSSNESPLDGLPDEALTWLEFLAIVARVLDLPVEDAPKAILNQGMAESALAAPHAAFGGAARHPDPIARAAMLGVSICRNHSLVDGNKRVALIATTIQLGRLGLRIVATQPEIADVVESLAAGETSDEAFVEWVRSHLASRPD